MVDKIYTGKERSKIVLALSKMLSDTKNPLKDVPDTDLCVMDEALVLMVIAKTYRAKNLLKDFMDKSQNKPDIKFDSAGFGKFSITYITTIINFFKTQEDNFIKIKTGHELPSIFKNDDWELILAPRIE